MALFIRTICFFLIISCFSMILVECIQSEHNNDGKVKESLSETPISSYYQLYEKQQQQQQYNQNQFNNLRPSQHLTNPSYTGYSFPAAPLTHSRGATILPPNNQIQASNFHNQQAHISSLESYQTGLNNNNNFIPSKIKTTEPVLSSINNSSNKQQHHFFGLSSVSSKEKNQKSDLERGIELALRQTNGDENVFQPLPIIETPPEQHNNFDWNSSPEAVQQNYNQVNNKNSNIRQELSAQSSDESNDSQSKFAATTSASAPEITTTTTTSTEHNNNIAVQNEIPSKENQHDHNSKLETFGKQNAHYPIEQAQSSRQHHQGPQQHNDSNQILFLNSNQSSRVDINNQVTYEGPATAPPVGEGYYFSTSEKQPNSNEMKTSNAWWAIGFGHEFELASNLTTNNYMGFCLKSELLINNKQRLLCKTHYKIMSIVARGLKMAIDECQVRFAKNRWNCSLAIQQESLLSMQQSTLTNNNKNGNVQVFGELMKQPIRERSFLNAIIAAGLAHSMTKACSQGELPEECSCDKRIRSRNNNKVEWVACSDDIDYGAKFSRDFTDNTEYDSDTTSMINTHNYEVGRRVLKSLTDITCTCQNGENGLCQTKKCWKHLGQFSDIGDELMKRYESATHVQLSNKNPHKLRPVRRGVRKPKRRDLVYIDESPDYCNQDTRLGVLGTQNRHCNSTSLEQDSCSLLCCGRGYQVVVEEIEEDCNCKFVWCCQVKCDKCKKQVTYDICN